MSGRPSYLQLLRNRSFGSLWLAQLVSQSGDGVFDVALLWLVFVTTKSTALVGLTQAAVLVPAVFAAPVAGVYVDRLNRRNVMIASNLAQGAITGVLALLYFSGTLAFPALILFVLLLYTGAQFFRAANTAIIPSIVGPGELGAANGLFTLTTSANQLASYTVGGAVVAAIGAGASITYDSLTFFVAAVILTFVPMSYGAAMALAENWQPVASSFMSEFREGLSYIRRSRLLLELIVFGTVVNFFFGGLGALIAPYVNQQLHGDAFDYGVTLSAYALGTIAGSFVVGKVNFRRYVGKLLFAGILGAGVAILLSGVATTVPGGAAAFGAIGAFAASVNLPLQVLIQSKVPGNLLGRIVTVLGSLVSATIPVAAVLFGAVAEFSTVGQVFVVSGAAVMLTSVVLYIPFSELRSAGF